MTKAVQIDSTFAMAHLGLATASDWRGLYEERDVHLELAKKYRYKATHKEQIILDDWYDRAKGNDRSKSIRALIKGTRLYPKEKQVFLNEILLSQLYR